jgi:hypothetical protein
LDDQIATFNKGAEVGIGGGKEENRSLHYPEKASQGRGALGYYHRATFLQLTTFLQFHLVSSILPQSSYFFLWYFLFRCSLYEYEFCEISDCMKEKKRDDIHY